MGKKSLSLLLIIGGATGLRILILFWDYAFDVNNHISWAQDAIAYGFRGFYETPSKEVYATIYPNYPPLAIFLFYPLFFLRDVLSQMLWQINLIIPAFPSKIIPFTTSRAFLAGVFKIPALLADFGLAWICCLFARKIAPAKKTMHLMVFALILFNPTIFYNSSFWGQIDSIPVLFSLSAFYLALFTQRYRTSAILITLALLVKPTPLVYLPVFALVFFQRFGAKKMLLAFAIGSVVFWLAFLPFYREGNLLLFPFMTYIKKILETQSLANVTNQALNVWAVNPKLAWIPDTNTFLLNLSYRFWGAFLSLSLALFIIRQYWRIKSNSIGTIMYMTFLISFTIYIFATKMHERYFFLPLPFLLLAAVRYKSLMKLWVVLTLASFINLYGSWPVPPVDFLAKALATPSTRSIFSVFNVGLYAYSMWWFANPLLKRK